MKREGSAVWEGTLSQGKGALSTGSNTLSSTPYSFRSRFEQGAGTNPEELIAAAHAGCFSMALSHELESKNITPGRIETRAIVSMDRIAGKWTIHEVRLELTARASEHDQPAFLEAAERAKTNCPVSQLLKADIKLETRFEPVSVSKSA